MPSLLFRLSLPLISASFLSTKSINSLKLVARSERLLRLESSGSSTFCSSHSGSYLRYCRHTLQKNMERAKKLAMPQMRNRPQKLVRESLVASTWLLFAEHPSSDSHLSWIRWRSPFSDSCRIAVDKSTARGESL